MINVDLSLKVTAYTLVVESGQKEDPLKHAERVYQWLKESVKEGDSSKVYNLSPIN